MDESIMASACGIVTVPPPEASYAEEGNSAPCLPLHAETTRARHKGNTALARFKRVKNMLNLHRYS
jgi:hypothetical protein